MPLAGAYGPVCSSVFPGGLRLERAADVRHPNARRAARETRTARRVKLVSGSPNA